MEKTAYPNPYAAYEKHIGSEPVLDTAVGGGVGTAAGYLGANVLLNPLISAVAGMTNADPEKVRRLQQKLKSYGAAAGGIAGLAYGANKHLDTKSGLSGAWKSMTDGQYWKDNPQATIDNLRAYRDNIRSGKESIRTPSILKLIQDATKIPLPTRQGVARMNMEEQERQRMEKQRVIREIRQGLQKQQSFSDAFTGYKVPVDYAMNIISGDPFLSLGEKAVTNHIIENSGDVDTDGAGIMTSALRFGVAFAPSYLLGRSMSNILGLPTDKIKKLSGAGGIAAGILNTGIFGGN